jgi:hypothetical protein
MGSIVNPIPIAFFIVPLASAPFSHVQPNGLIQQHTAKLHPLECSKVIAEGCKEICKYFITSMRKVHHQMCWST